MKTLLITTLFMGLANLLMQPMNKPAYRTAETPVQLHAIPVITGNVVAIRELKLKAGVDPDTFERFATEEFTPTFLEQVPGVKAYILKGERGDKKEKYSFALIFDSVNTRDYYYPFEHGGEASVPKNAEVLWLPARKMIYERLAEYVEYIGEEGGYTDYVVLGNL